MYSLRLRVVRAYVRFFAGFRVGQRIVPRITNGPERKRKHRTLSFPKLNVTSLMQLSSS